MYTEKLKKRLYELQVQNKSILKELKNYPPGHLSILANGKYKKWFQVLPGKRIYIPKKNRKKAETLAKKLYLSCQLADQQIEIKAIQAYLRILSSNPRMLDKLQDSEEFQSIISNELPPLPIELENWSKEAFVQNKSHPEQLRVPCLSGHRVRSKSEGLIDQALMNHNIPFRYECELVLGNITLYPDFTIRHPTTGEFFYWEHFGIMDNPSYVHNVFQKLELFTSNKILPTFNLIMTFEDNEHPLDAVTVEEQIKKYLL